MFSWYLNVGKVDSKLAQQSSLAGVSEILNGCMYVFRCSDFHTPPS